MRMVVLSVVPSVYMMTHNGNDIIAPTAQAATPAVTFPSLCSKAALPSPSLFLVIAVVVVVVLVIFKSLHLVEICTLTSAFYTVSQKKACDYIFCNNWNNECPIIIIFLHTY